MFGAIVAALLWAPAAHALPVPELAGRVVDRADILPPDTEARIGELLAAHEKRTGQQFAVLSVPSLEGEAIEDFSIRVVEKWKLGKEKKDDGLLLLVVPRDRRVRIEVGYGLEGEITDALSARIIRNLLGPAFRSGDYGGGIERALGALMQAGSGTAVDLPEAESPRSAAPRGAGALFILLLFVLPVLLPLFFASRFGGRRRRGGGVFFGPTLGGGGGFGGFSGGGFSGGGFSGGGGSFGGGGASGSW